MSDDLKAFLEAVFDQDHVIAQLAIEQADVNDDTRAELSAEWERLWAQS